MVVRKSPATVAATTGTSGSMIALISRNCWRKNARRWERLPPGAWSRWFRAPANCSMRPLLAANQPPGRPNNCGSYWRNIRRRKSRRQCVKLSSGRHRGRVRSLSFSIAAVAVANIGFAPSTSHAIRIWRTWRFPHTNWRFTMNSLQTMNNDLTGQLRQLGLARTARELDDLIARATKQQWSPLQLIEAIAKSEAADRASRNLERRLKQARLGRFKPIADFDWDWPQKIDRELVERSLKLSLIEERRNLILMGANGLGKTCIAKNIAYTAITAGKSVIFRTASELISDLSGESSQQRQRRLRLYSRVDLLCIDEVGYLAYDAGAADLLYEVIARRYEEGALVLTTNRAFKEWNEVFPHATCIATMLDRLLHHADVIVVEGHSYRVRESELEATARRKKK